MIDIPNLGSIRAREESTILSASTQQAQQEILNSPIVTRSIVAVSTR